MEKPSHGHAQTSGVCFRSGLSWESRAPRADVQIRAFVPSEIDELVNFLEGLSELARFYRFHFGCPRLASGVVRSLRDVDDRHHVALVAVSGDQIVGEARCVRLTDEPTCAEVGIAVANAFQERGVGRLLMQELARRAVKQGIRSFHAEVLLENRRTVQWLERRGAKSMYRAGSVASFRVPLQTQDARNAFE